MSMTSIVANVNRRIDTQIRKSTIELFGSVIKMTPVDTGRARGNWQCTIGSPATSEIERLDKTGSSAISEVVSTVKSGTVVWLGNNVPYISRLEYDSWSKQAPAGMVRVSLARFGAMFSEAASASMSQIK